MNPVACFGRNYQNFRRLWENLIDSGRFPCAFTEIIKWITRTTPLAPVTSGSKSCPSLITYLTIRAVQAKYIARNVVVSGFFIYLKCTNTWYTQENILTFSSNTQIHSSVSPRPSPHVIYVPVTSWPDKIFLTTVQYVEWEWIINSSLTFSRMKMFLRKKNVEKISVERNSVGKIVLKQKLTVLWVDYQSVTIIRTSGVALTFNHSFRFMGFFLFYRGYGSFVGRND